MEERRERGAEEGRKWGEIRRDTTQFANVFFFNIGMPSELDLKMERQDRKKTLTVIRWLRHGAR